jgi:hypothetical protein
VKQLQNNYTTPEQSKRLLELGVPADSADCAYRLGIGKFTKTLILIPKDTTYTAFADDSIFRVLEERCLPCWSAGRLIEIFIICTPYIEIVLRTRLIEQLIASYEDVIKQGLIDFSKLEI